MIVPTSNEFSRQSNTLVQLRERYRLILVQRQLTDREIDAVRKHVIRLAPNALRARLEQDALLICRL
jgi:hypothetical protein